VGIIPVIKLFASRRLVKILSIIVAELHVTLVGRFINGMKDSENIVLINADVG
jgi:hypothetical protein